jgi:hypothetical protein
MGLNEMAKNFDAADIGMIKVSVLVATLLIAKYWTEATSLAWYWYAMVFVLVLIRPLRHMFSK